MTAGVVARNTLSTPYDVERLRAEFPILSRRVHGKPLTYLDSAASSQMPQPVIGRLVAYLTHEHANVHRGVHALSEQATDAFEGARERVRRFLNAADSREIIFTRGTTEAINLVMSTYGRANVQAGDEIVITELEHHSNLVPWKMLCDEKRAQLRVVPINDAGEPDLDVYRALLGPRTRIVALAHVSNALGTINPVRDMIRDAHAAGAVVVVDGAQAVPHLTVDVQALDCDFYAFSGHKIYGPTGIGVLYGKAALLEDMPPFHGGGDMILSVSFDRVVYNTIPYKFEAGTPAIAQAIALGAALDYVTAVGLDSIGQHEQALHDYATARMRTISGLRLIGTACHKAGVISFSMDGVHPHDVGTILDGEGVAIRAGHHCAQPVMQHYCVAATARASFGLYNTRADVDVLISAIHKVRDIFGA